MGSHTYYYAGKPAASEYGWLFKLSLLLLLFGFMVIRNSGCASTYYADNLQEDNAVISVENDSSWPLSLTPGTVELSPGENYSAVMHVTGGKEPYAFFSGNNSGFELSILDSRTAMLKGDSVKILNGATGRTVYVLDGRGDLVSATVVVTSR